MVCRARFVKRVWKQASMEEFEAGEGIAQGLCDIYRDSCSRLLLAAPLN